MNLIDTSGVTPYYRQKYADSLGLSPSLGVSSPISFPAGGASSDSTLQMASLLLALQTQQNMPGLSRELNRAKLITDKKTSSDDNDDSDVTSEDTPDTTSTAGADETFKKSEGVSEAPKRSAWVAAGTATAFGALNQGGAGTTRNLAANGWKNVNTRYFGGLGITGSEAKQLGKITEQGEAIHSNTTASKVTKAFESYKDAAGNSITADTWKKAQESRSDLFAEKKFFGKNNGKSLADLRQMVADDFKGVTTGSGKGVKPLSAEQQAQIKEYVAKVDKAGVDIANNAQHSASGVKLQDQLAKRNGLIDDVDIAKEHLDAAKKSKDPTLIKEARKEFQKANQAYKKANGDFVAAAKEANAKTLTEATTHSGAVDKLRSTLRDKDPVAAKAELEKVLQTAKNSKDVRMQKTAEELLDKLAKDPKSLRTALKEASSSAKGEVIAVKSSEKALVTAAAEKTALKVVAKGVLKGGGIALAAGIEGYDLVGAAKKDKGTGKHDNLKKQGIKSAFGVAGGLAAGAVGAKVGAVAGTFIGGPIGTVLGFVVGAGIGAAGYYISSKFGEAVGDAAVG